MTPIALGMMAPPVSRAVQLTVAIWVESWFENVIPVKNGTVTAKFVASNGKVKSVALEVVGTAAS